MGGWKGLGIWNSLLGWVDKKDLGGGRLKSLGG